jgi:hypothetical protein
MGRTNRTFRDELRTVRDHWSDYRTALRRRNQERFDRLFEYGRRHADAGGHLNPIDPMLPTLFAIAIEHERQLEQLERRIEVLEGPASDVPEEPLGPPYEDGGE